MENAITIREMRTGDDLPSVLALCRDFFAEYESYHNDFFDTDNLRDADISSRFKRSLESDGSATIIALIDNVIVGYALLAIHEQPRFYKVKRVGAISGLMVAPEHRRKGIASGLLDEAREFFRKRGIRYFTLYTSVENHEAIAFYRKNGLVALHRSFLGET